MKPLGGKAYGSIPHLPGSRRDESDKLLNDGQVRMLTTERKDRKHDKIIVQEKLDGSCVSVARIDGEIKILGRAGYELHTSSYRQHHMFVDYVYSNISRFDELLEDNERVVGEWLAMAHGIKYTLSYGQEPFVPFDIMTGAKRVPYDEFEERVTSQCFTTPHLIHRGCPYPLEIAKGHTKSKHGGEFSEGVVYRLETNGEVNFLAKWVNPRHICGKYFDSENIVWNIQT